MEEGRLGGSEEKSMEKRTTKGWEGDIKAMKGEGKG